MNKQLTTIVLSRYFVQISFILLIIVIPLGFEPKTHSLEGCCSNPTELRNQQFFTKCNRILAFFIKAMQRYYIFLKSPNILANIWRFII